MPKYGRHPDPLKILPAETVGGSSLRRYIIDMARRDSLSIGQLYQRVLPAIGGPVFKGCPTQVADEMENWWRAKAADGFTIMAPINPKGLCDFMDHVVPELQRRGHPGLPHPQSIWRNAATSSAAE